jgi:hypothetical protein
MMAELVTCRVPEDLISPAPVEGYVVSFVAIQCAIAPITLITATLLPRAAQPNPFRDPAHCGPRDPVRGPYGD